MRPTLRQLQYLVAIADTGRFGDAAKRLHVSQPSLSAQIAEMETELGIVLMERGRKGAILTPLGEEISSRARLVLREVEDLKALARQSLGGLTGRLRLGVLPSVGPYLLPSATKRLHAQHPDLRIAVREEKTVDLEEHLAAGMFDMIISTAEDHGGHASVKLFQEQLWVCAAPDDVLAQSQDAVSLFDLKGRTVLTLGPGHRFSELVSQIARQAGAKVSETYQGTSLDATRQMAMMGAGIAILPSLYVRLEAQRDRDIALRPIAHKLANREISLIWRARSPLAERFEAIADVLGQTAADLLAPADLPTL
ncbi:MAG: LysR substrate-binding domain-containing protein [Pseudomonadota bacterium]